MSSIRDLLGDKPYAYFFTDVCEPLKPMTLCFPDLHLMLLEDELKNLEEKLQEMKRQKCDLLHALFLLHCIRHLKGRIQQEKGEPLFDKPAEKPIKNQRRRSK